MVEIYYCTLLYCTPARCMHWQIINHDTKQFIKHADKSQFHLQHNQQNETTYGKRCDTMFFFQN